jgi:hypothetical protein
MIYTYFVLCNEYMCIHTYLPNINMEHYLHNLSSMVLLQQFFIFATWL